MSVSSITQPGHRPMSLARALGALAFVWIAGSTLYSKLFRPLQRGWGATPEELTEPLPGDDRIPRPNYNSTHAITIDAPPAEVWPWLVQMGQGRAGLYSYDLLENLAGLNIHSATRIVPEFQNLKLGDIVPLAPNGMGPAVEAIEPPALLQLGAHDDGFTMTWVWVLRELAGGRTRLVVRWRAHYLFTASLNKQMLAEFRKAPWRTFSGLVIARFVGIGQFIMERGMLKGIKQRVERGAYASARVPAAAPTR